MNKKVNILGTQYKKQCKNKKQDAKLEKCDGYCDYTNKTIVCVKREKEDLDIMDLENLQSVDRRILRHEIIHAFMYESGLWCNSFNVQQWAMSEEMTDWFAIQSPKIFKIFKQLKILEVWYGKI